MEKRLNNGLPNPTPIDGRTGRDMSLAGGLLAFVLSAVMAIGFMALVNKTHDLLADAQLKVPVIRR